MASKLQKILAVLLALVVDVENCNLTLNINLPEDAKLNFMELAEKYGHGAKAYDVVTKDGYVLTVFNIPGNKSVPVLLMHGIFDTADSFVLRGYTSLAITLSSKGYDVWIGNCRGNKYSRRHVSISPESSKFWDFSFHEYGYYDFPATIDFVLNKTDNKKLSVIGHSMGNAIFYVLGSMKPEYNKKIKIAIAMAPICFLHNTKPPVSVLISLGPAFNLLTMTFHLEEIFGQKSFLRYAMETFCTQGQIGYDICANGVMFQITGPDPDELELEFYPINVAHYPLTSSRKTISHFAQVGLRKKFGQYDYGIAKNLLVYRSIYPPEYPLNKVKMPVLLLSGKNDRISTLEDVELLKQGLPNVVDHIIIDHELMNHNDFLVGRNMPTYLFPHILNALSLYSI